MKRFLFYVPSVATPTGGVSVILDWVQILRANGFQAEAFSDSPDYSYKFGKAHAEILYIAEAERKRVLHRKGIVTRVLGLGRAGSSSKDTLSCREDDVVIIPEYAANWLPDAFPTQQLVLLVQAFTMFSNPDYLSGIKTKRFGSVIAVSDICEGYSRFAGFTPVHKVPIAIASDIFFPRPKENTICYMPRRRPGDIDLVLNALRLNKRIEDFQLCPIDRMPIAKVAEAMGRSRIFLSFSQREGFGLPPAEAMASGCLVVGFTGGGGDEYFDPSWSFPISEGNLPKFVETIEKVVADCRHEPSRMDAMAKTAAATVSARYSAEAQRQAILNVFGAMSNPERNATSGLELFPGSVR